jgi:uncharacterized protein (TIGR02145 family)
MKSGTRIAAAGFFVLLIASGQFDRSQEVKRPPAQVKAKPGAEIAGAKAIPSCGTVSYGGKTYHTIQIGSQCWLRENLDIGQLIPPGKDQTDNGIVEKYSPVDDERVSREYGGLYQWLEAMQYKIAPGPQGICPPGFHIPSEGEWNALFAALGGEAVAGKKLREAGFVHWNAGNSGATNESGFSARGAGIRDYDKGRKLFQEEAWFWTDSGSATGKTARCVVLRSDSDGIEWKTVSGTTGLSVRCLR